MRRRSTRKHEVEQERAARRYGRARGVHMERAPGGHFGPIDYIAKASDRMGAEALEVVELKCRSCGVGAFPTVWCEVRKIHSLRRWREVYSCAGTFVVEWADGEIRRIDVGKIPAVCSPFVARRTDRNDAGEHDADVVYAVPIAAMEVVVAAGKEGA